MDWTLLRSTVDMTRAGRGNMKLLQTKTQMFLLCTRTRKSSILSRRQTFHRMVANILRSSHRSNCKGIPMSSTRPERRLRSASTFRGSTGRTHPFANNLCRYHSQLPCTLLRHCQDRTNALAPQARSSKSVSRGGSRRANIGARVGRPAQSPSRRRKSQSCAAAEAPSLAETRDVPNRVKT